MTRDIHLQAIERLISSIYPSGDQLLCSFMYGQPGSPVWQHRYEAEIYVRRRDYLDAVLYIRRNGAPYLRAISIADLRSMITQFVIDNFWYIGGRNLLPNPVKAYGMTMRPAEKLALANALAESPMFVPTSELTLYPLIPVRVIAPFDSERFVLTAPDHLNRSHLPETARDSLDSGNFPPITDWSGVRRPVGSWLGVRSPLRLVSDKMASAILGAVALTQLPRQRYLFSGRQVFGGKCTVSSSVTISTGDGAHTPPMMHDIVLTVADHAWLVKLDSLLAANDKRSRSKLRALEYFHRAWFLDPRERFAPLCMSLDALVGADNGHTSAAVKFVKGIIDSGIDEARLRLLMRIRGAVIHGAAPDVYDSENYEQYWLDYSADPIRDLELIVAKCLRQNLFAGSLAHHAGPHAALLAEMRSRGRIPKVLDPDAIIPAEL